MLFISCVEGCVKRHFDCHVCRFPNENNSEKAYGRLRPKICCLSENLAVNCLTFTVLCSGQIFEWAANLVAYLNEALSFIAFPKIRRLILYACLPFILQINFEWAANLRAWSFWDKCSLYILYLANKSFLISYSKNRLLMDY